MKNHVVLGWIFDVLPHNGFVPLFGRCLGLLGMLLASANAQPPKDSAPAEQRTPAAMILGDSIYRPASPVTVYLLKRNDKSQSLDLHLLARDKMQPDSLSLRIFDPMENLILREHLDRKGDGPLTVLGTLEREAIAPTTWPDSPWKFKVGAYKAELHAAGVYEVRMVSGRQTTALQLESSAPLPRGVSFQNGIFTPWKNTVAKCWFYIPGNAMELKIKGTGLTVTDDQGAVVYPAPGSPVDTLSSLPIKRKKVVWTISFADPKKWQFSAAGLPVILCEDPATAVAFGASVQQLPDGTYVNHRFQREIAKVLPSLLTPEKVGDSEALASLFDADPEVWKQGDTALALRLRGPYGIFPHVQFALREQNLDPLSHWGGTIGKKVWEPRLAAQLPDDRWDFLRSIPDFRGQGRGGISSGAYAASLAGAYLLNQPYNPYYKKPEILNRAVAAALRDMMAVSEDEIVPGSASDLDSYPGFPGFLFAKRYFPEFGLLSPLVPEEIRRPWQDGMRRLFDRYWAEGLVSTRNQNAHMLIAFQNFAMGTGDPKDLDLAKRFAARFIAGASKAGYNEEAGGPCGTYCGIQHFYMAEYYRLSGDKDMLEAIRKSYIFYNHTVAPETNGKAYGGFNFSHRVPGGFHAEQFQGAKNWLGDELPEVALWKVTEGPSSEAMSKALMQSIGKPLAQPSFPPLIPLLDPDSKIASGNQAVWPALEKASFSRNFGGDLIAIKRPHYYAAFFVGKPLNNSFYLKGGDKGLHPPANEAESAGGNIMDLYTQKANLRPFNNAGFTLLWSPEYGNAVLAGTAAFTHHGLVAVTKDELRHAEDYFSASSTMSEDNSVLTSRGKLDSLPLEYIRKYTFRDDSIDIELTLRATKAFAVESFCENIPVAAGTFKPNGSRIVIDGTEIEVDKNKFPEALREKIDLRRSVASQFHILDDHGNGFLTKLDSGRPLLVCRSGLHSSGDIRHDRVEISLPTTWKEGETLTLRYQFIPVRGETQPTAAQSLPAPSASANPVEK